MRAFFELLGRLIVATPIVLAALLIVAVAVGLAIAAGRFAVHMGGPALLAAVIAVVAASIAYRVYRKRVRNHVSGKGTPDDVRAYD